MTALSVQSLAMEKKMGSMVQTKNWLKLKQSHLSSDGMSAPHWKENQKYFSSKLVMVLDEIQYLSRVTATPFHLQVHLCQQMLTFSSVLLRLQTMKATVRLTLVHGSSRLLLMCSRNMQKESISWIWCWELTTVLLDFTVRRVSSKYHARSACYKRKCFLIQSIAEHEFYPDKEFILQCLLHGIFMQDFKLRLSDWQWIEPQ